MSVLETAQKFMWDYPVEFAYALWRRDPKRYEIVELYDDTANSEFHIAARDTETGYIYDATGAYRDDEDIIEMHCQEITRSYSVKTIDDPSMYLDADTFFEDHVEQALGRKQFSPDNFDHNLIGSKELQNHIDRVLKTGKQLDSEEDMSEDYYDNKPQWRELQPGSYEVLMEFLRICEITDPVERENEISDFEISNWHVSPVLTADEYERTAYMIACQFDSPEMLRLATRNEHWETFDHEDDDGWGFEHYIADVKNPVSAQILIDSLSFSNKDFDSKIIYGLTGLLTSKDSSGALFLAQTANEVRTRSRLSDAEEKSDEQSSLCLTALEIGKHINSGKFRYTVAKELERFTKEIIKDHEVIGREVDPEGAEIGDRNIKAMIENLKSLAQYASISLQEKRMLETTFFSYFIDPSVPFQTVYKYISGLLHKEHLNDACTYDTGLKKWLTPIQYCLKNGNPEVLNFFEQELGVSAKMMGSHMRHGSPLELAEKAKNHEITNLMKQKVSADHKESILDSFSGIQKTSMPKKKNACFSM